MIVLEASRGIYESEIEAAYHKLAASSERATKAQQPFKDAIQRRVMNVNRRLAGKENFQNILTHFNNTENSSHIRKTAYDFLIQWDQKVNRDLCTGRWWPMDSGNAKDAREALSAISQNFITDKNQENWAQFFELCSKFNVEVPAEKSSYVITKGNDSAKIAALNYQQAKAPADAAKNAMTFLSSQSPKLRSAGLNYLNTANPKQALKTYDELLGKKDINCEIKQTCLKNLAKMKSPESQTILVKWMKNLDAGNVDQNIAFDILEAARSNKENKELSGLLNHFESKASSSSDPLAKYKILLHGGNVENGKNLFKTHPAAQCFRCHKVDKEGGEAGPDLSKIASVINSEQILESLISPNSRIAPGFGIVTLTTKAGKSITGIVTSETDQELKIKIDEKNSVRVKTSDIANRGKSISPMPPMGLILKPHELRDILAFLQSRK